jgi:hypothetical protein
VLLENTAIFSEREYDLFGADSCGRAMTEGNHFRRGAGETKQHKGELKK